MFFFGVGLVFFAVSVLHRKCALANGDLLPVVCVLYVPPVLLNSIQYNTTHSDF